MVTWPWTKKYSTPVQTVKFSVLRFNLISLLHTTGESASEEFWKSAKIRQSYRHDVGVFLFWNTVYIVSNDDNVAPQQLLIYYMYLAKQQLQLFSFCEIIPYISATRLMFSTLCNFKRF